LRLREFDCATFLGLRKAKDATEEGRVFSGGGKMKSWCPHRRVRQCLAIALFLAGLLSSRPVSAQLPKAATSSEPAPAQPSEESPPDPLGRATPRGTVLGFLTSAYENNFDTAAQYLNTRLRGKDAASLAEQLLVVLDRKLPPKLNNISNDPQGSMSDPLDPRRELIGSVASEDGKVDIYLERVDRPKSTPIWLFSRQTLTNIPDLSNEIKSASQETVLPEIFWRRFLGFSVFGWVFFVSLPVLYFCLGVIHRLLVFAWKHGQGRWAKWPPPPNLKALLHPIRLLILSLAIHATLAHFSTSLVARQVGSITETLILIVSIAWLAIIINRWGEDYLKKRMESQGRLGSTAILRPARGMMNVIVVIIGLMFALHSFGINPSAFLAGLGVGGIAIALAAQKTLENVIGGASVILDEAVRVGDSFKIGDVVGTVEAVGLRSTRIRTLDRTLVTIPNGQMATMTLENYSARDNFWLRHLVGLGYDTQPSNLNAVLAAVRELLSQDSRVVPASVRVRFLRFSESSLDLEVFAYVLAPDWNHFLEIQEELLMQIREVIASNGAEIAYPVRTIHVRTERKPEDLPAPQPQNITSGEDGFLT
jgi:MscS family membrane protein